MPHISCARTLLIWGEKDRRMKSGQLFFVGGGLGWGGRSLWEKKRGIAWITMFTIIVWFWSNILLLIMKGALEVDSCNSLNCAKQFSYTHTHTHTHFFYYMVPELTASLWIQVLFNKDCSPKKVSPFHCNFVIKVENGKK
jgi:hypothetical protein